MFRTNYVPQTLNPKWDDDDVPVLPCMTADLEVLRNSHLMICMQDYDRLDPDDDMGFGTINLGPFIDAPGDFDASFVLNGQQAGWVRGRLEMVWPEEGGRKQRKQKDQCRCSVL